jgi:hypothetical protein
MAKEISRERIERALRMYIVGSEAGHFFAVNAAYNVETGTLIVRCRTCHEQVCVLLPADLLEHDIGKVVGKMANRVDSLGKCRGAPLYVAIPGTPWFDYSPKKERVAQ